MNSTLTVHALESVCMWVKRLQYFLYELFEKSSSLTDEVVEEEGMAYFEKHNYDPKTAVGMTDRL